MKLFLLMLLMPFVALADVPYITGGTGEENRQEIETQAYKYNLQVKAAFTTGHYIADVEIAIANEDGMNLLSAVTEGPYFYAKLEPGTYTVTASFEGETKEQKVTIGEETKLREAMFRFKPDSDPMN